MRTVVFIAALCAFVASPVMAGLYGTADVTNTGLYVGEQVQIMDTAHLVSPISLQAGLWNLTIDNALKTDGVTPLAFPGYGVLDDTIGFCLDILDPMGFTVDKFNVVSLDLAPDPAAGPMGPTRARLVAELLDTYWGGGGSMTTQYAAAVQAAIWEIVNEDSGSYTVTPPISPGVQNFYLTQNPGVINLANSMLSTINPVGGGADHSIYIGLYNPTEPFKGELQDYLVRVPVPGAVLLGILGLGVVGIKLRKYA